MKKNIFFDFFGVISCEVAPVYFKDRFSEEEAKRIKDEIFVPADRGDIDEETSYVLISKATNEDIEVVRKIWYEMVEINQDLVNYILELKKEHRIYLLSNAISSFLRKILKDNDLNRLFDKEFISSDFHLIKPNSEFFSYVTNDLGLDPKTCIMIDDNPHNIMGAEAIGINGIVFKGVNDLKKKIKEIESR